MGGGTGTEDAAAGADGVRVSVEGFRIRHAQLEHPVPAYVVRIEKPNAEWREELNSSEAARIFLRGIQAGFSMAGGGHVSVPGVPPEEHLKESE